MGDSSLGNTLRRFRVPLFVLSALFFLHLLFRSQPHLQPKIEVEKWTTQIKAYLGSSTAKTIEHPIPKLMLAAHLKYKGMMGRQSKTLEEAVKEYERRYGRAPPKGFDDWFAFVKENDCKIVDEYDSMIKDLEPFWSLEGVEFRRRAEQIGELAAIDLVRIRNGNMTIVNVNKLESDAEVSARAIGFGTMIEKYLHKLPDMTFAINARSEGRVLVPWTSLEYPNSTNQDSSSGLGSMLNFGTGETGDRDAHLIPDWRGTSSVWEAFRQTCPPGTEARRLFHSLRGHGSAPSAFSRATGQAVITTTSGSSQSDPTQDEDEDPYQGAGPDFSFVEGVQNGFDYCAHPAVHTQSGHFFSDWRTIPALYPLLSPAKAPGFGDLVIPSHYYYASTKRYTYGYDQVNTVVKDTDDSDFPWNRKADKIFWRGGATGGGSSPPGYMAQYQRHRFVRMAALDSTQNKTVVFAHPNKPNEYHAYQVPQKALNEDMIDAAFTKTVGCQNYPGGCTAMFKEMRVVTPGSLGENWKYKYVLDLDGPSYSAKFFAILASHSAAIKASVHREFYHDWIQPWLHYIPLSGGYDELYNIYGYFSPPTAKMAEIASQETNETMPIGPGEPSEGEVLLHKIARAGRAWKSHVGRRVDMEAYVYRLCLEYARLWADDRDAWGFVMG